MNQSIRRRAVRLGFFVSSLIASSLTGALAQSDLPHPLITWSLSPTNGNWNIAANWTPPNVPDTQGERAAFGSSSVTSVTAFGEEVHSVEFNAGASQYTITGDLVFNGGGVINNSGIMQTFSGNYTFQKGATVSSLVTFEGGNFDFARTERSGTGCSAGSGTYNNNGNVEFSTRSTAGNATFTGNSNIIRFDKADAGNATLVNNGGSVFGGEGGLIKFRKSSADNSTIINNGGAVFGAHGSRLTFHKSSADSATLIANGGAGPGSGATILFTQSSGDTARIEVFGNGNLDVSRLTTTSYTFGSLEGNGLVFLGGNHITAGGNNLNTTFAGVISDEGGIQNGSGGSFAKDGTGTLTFTGANTYTGGTSVEAGSLLVNNTTGSGTGSGAVQVDAGTLGGAGTIAGPVTVGSGGVLSPGSAAGTVGILTLQDTLSFDSGATCEVELNSTTPASDVIAANGITIDSAAQFSITDLGNTTLAVGTSFTIIDNTAATAISGAFANLADGATITLGSNTFQADYQGGDGNDLTLTVIP